MSKQQTSTQIAAEQMFIDNSFWDEVEGHLQKRQPETLENATVERISDQPRSLADARINSVE